MNLPKKENYSKENADFHFLSLIQGVFTFCIPSKQNVLLFINYFLCFGDDGNHGGDDANLDGIGDGDVVRSVLRTLLFQLSVEMNNTKRQ